MQPDYLTVDVKRNQLEIWDEQILLLLLNVLPKSVILQRIDAWISGNAYIYAFYT